MEPLDGSLALSLLTRPGTSKCRARQRGVGGTRASEPAEVLSVSLMWLSRSSLTTRRTGGPPAAARAPRPILSPVIDALVTTARFLVFMYVT